MGSVNIIPQTDANGHVINHSKSYSDASNITEDGKVLYKKIHGIKADVPSGQTHSFQFQIPYSEVFFRGAEIVVDIVSVSNFKILIPPSTVSEQYGYSVNMGKILYMRESEYTARLPQGIIIECECTNDTNETLEMGVNFLLDELREPAP